MGGSLKDSVNRIRKSATQKLTCGIGTKGNRMNLTSSSGLRILVVRPNHRLGNQLLLTPLINELTEIFPDCRIDLFVRGNLASLIFRNYPNVKNILRLPKKPFSSLPSYVATWFRLAFSRYDLVINAAGGSSSGRIATRITSSGSKMYGITDSDPLPPNHMALLPVYQLRHELRNAGFADRDSVPLMDLRLTHEEIQNGRNRLLDVTPGHKPVISLFTFATGRKRYSAEWWKHLLMAIAENFPETEIIEVLPVENISAFNFSIPSFYSRDIRELAAVIRNTAVFIGADSGIMHLAEASHVPTIGLFQVTRPAKYGPYGPGSVAIDTRISGTHDIISHLNKVLRGSPAVMHTPGKYSSLSQEPSREKPSSRPQ